jgi:hypothetical protein
MGPLAEDSAAKLIRAQLNVCTVYSPPPPPAAVSCAGLAGNFLQWLVTVTSVANDMDIWFG